MHTPQINIYLAVFLSSYAGYEDNSCGKTYRMLSDALKGGLWPFDVGDDPSFPSQKRFGSNLTWRICRPQVRNRIKPGDVVVFFSVRRKSTAHPFEYCFCAVATVERKVRHTDLWQDATLKKSFRRYLNLLIRPCGKRDWEHHEPGTEKPHNDWLWRITDRDGLRRDDFKPLEAGDLLSPNARINGCPLSIAENYVIFSASRQQTRIMPRPPLVAICEANGQCESWLDDRTSRTIRAKTLRVARQYGSRRDSLRSVHKQHSHPVIRWGMPSGEAARWRANLLGIFDQHAENELGGEA